MKVEFDGRVTESERTIPWQAVAVAAGASLVVFFLGLPADSQLMTTEQKQHLCRALFVVAGLITLLAGYFDWRYGQAITREKEERSNAAKEEERARTTKVGTLKPRNDASPLEHPYENDLLAGNPSFEVGNSGAVMPGGFIGGLIDALSPWVRTTWFRARKVDGQIKVSLRIYDASGDLAAELIENDWKVAPAPQTFDRNYSTNAIEVIDSRGDVVLQVVVLQDRIQLLAKTFGPDGISQWIAQDFTEDGRPYGLLLTAKSPRQRLMIRPIFKYPSDLHLGRLVAALDDEEPNRSIVFWPDDESEAAEEPGGVQLTLGSQKLFRDVWLPAPPPGTKRRFAKPTP